MPPDFLSSHRVFASPPSVTEHPHISSLTPVPLKILVNIDDYQHQAMGKWAGVEQVPVKWAFSRRA